MVSDAESHAEDDRRLRELAEARNTAEQVVYATEKSLAEHESKLDDETKDDIQRQDRRCAQLARGRRCGRDPHQARGAARGLVQAGRACLPAGSGGRCQPGPAAATATAAEDSDEEIVDAEVVDEAERRPVIAREPAAQRARRRGCRRRNRAGGRRGGPGGRVRARARASWTQARRQAEEYLADLRRVAADFDNFRKRVARDAEEQARRAIEGIVGELLPVLDNLERALDASEHHEEAKVAEGVQPGAPAAGRTPAPARPRADRRRAGRRRSTRTCTRRCPISPPSIPKERSPPSGSGATGWATASCAPPAWSSPAVRPAGEGAEPTHGDSLRHPGRPQGREPGGDQEGLPQAGAPVPPRRAIPATRRAEERFKQIGEAYDMLSDPEKRKQYDTFGQTSAPGPGRSGGCAGLRLLGAALPNFDLGDLFGGLFNRGGAGAVRRRRRSAAADVEAQVELSFDDALQGVTVKRAGGQGQRLPRLPRLGRSAGHLAHHLPRLQGPRRDRREPGILRAQPPLPALRRRRHGDRASRARDCHGAGPRALDQDLSGADSCRRAGRHPHQGCAARARRLRAAGSPAICTWSPRWRPSPLYSRRGDDLVIDVPVTFTRGRDGLAGRAADPRRQDRHASRCRPARPTASCCGSRAAARPS